MKTTMMIIAIVLCAGCCGCSEPTQYVWKLDSPNVASAKPPNQVVPQVWDDIREKLERVPLPLESKSNEVQQSNSNLDQRQPASIPKSKTTPVKPTETPFRRPDENKNKVRKSAVQKPSTQKRATNPSPKNRLPVYSERVIQQPLVFVEQPRSCVPVYVQQPTYSQPVCPPGDP